MKEKIRSLTSDLVVNVSIPYKEDFYDIEIKEIETSKGMTLIIDSKRFNDIEVGDQIDIYLKVTK